MEKLDSDRILELKLWEKFEEVSYFVRILILNEKL